MSQSSDDEILAIAREGFLAEAQEMLRQFEDALLGLETTPDDSETLNAAFRAAHTIKGTAGLFGYSRVVSFTHEVEALLDVMRAGQRQADEATIALLLQSRDQIDALLGDTATEHGDPDIAARSIELGAQLRALIGGEAPAASSAVQADPAEAASDDELSAWRIEARFGPDALRNGLDPLSFIRYLEKRGQYARMRVLDERIPDLDNLDAESCYLGFATEFATAEGRAVIESAFEFALDDCELVIAPLGQGNAVGAPTAAVAVAAEAPAALAGATPVTGEPQALEQVERGLQALGLFGVDVQADVVLARQLGQAQNAREQLVHHALPLGAAVAWVQGRQLDGDAGPFVNAAPVGCLADGVDGLFVGLVVARGVFAGERGLAQHVVGVAEAFGFHGAGVGQRIGNGLARHELLTHHAHGHVHALADQRLAAFANEPPQRCREAALAVRGRELAGQQQAPGGSVDEERGALAQVRIPLAVADLVADERIARGFIGNAQQRLGQAHQRHAFLG